MRRALILAALGLATFGAVALAQTGNVVLQPGESVTVEAAPLPPSSTVTETTTVTTTVTPPSTTTPPPPTCVGTLVAPGGGLKTAMDTAPAGTTFCLAAGTYSIPATITVKDGVAVQGAGRAQTFLVGTGAQNLFTAVSGATWEFRSLDISGAVGNPSVCGADCGRAFVGNGDSLTVTDVRCHDNQNQCVGSGSADLHFVGNECDHNGNAAFAAATARSTSCIKRVRGGASDITTEVRDSFIHDNIWVGVWFDFYEGVAIVENNVITGNGKAGIQYEVSGGFNARDNAVFSNNTIQDNGLTGISTIGGGIICNTCADLLADSNDFGGNFQHLAFKFINSTREWGNIHGVIVRNNILNGDTVNCIAGVTCSGNA